MSDQILYNEVKAEKSYLSIINAAFSHELRNPLNSLTGQVSSMRNLFHSFSAIILIFREKGNTEAASQLEKIY
jgi:signal transduction histidine kinase